MVGIRQPIERRTTPKGKTLNLFADDPVISKWRFSALVTDLDLPAVAVWRLYRDRAVAGHAFFELKNQWGWGGFTTHDPHRCQLTARAVALVYNGWSLFVRLAHPKTRRETIISRPCDVLSEAQDRTCGSNDDYVDRFARSFREGARAALMRVSALLQGWVVQVTEQLISSTVWTLVCDHLKHVLVGMAPPATRKMIENYATGIG